MSKFILTAVLFFSHLYSGSALTAHSLVGSWKHQTSKIEISDSGEVSTNVTTLAGYKQKFAPLEWFSTSSTTGYYVSKGYFEVTHGKVPYQIHCRHRVRLIAYIDGNSQRIVANFSCPSGFWAVWQPEGGQCFQEGEIKTQLLLEK